MWGDATFVADPYLDYASTPQAKGTDIDAGLGWTIDSREDYTQALSGGWNDQAGYYTTVPEPTSGLLLLLGVAGLALRRRRA